MSDDARKLVRDVLCANMFDGCDGGMLTMKTSVLLDDASEIIVEVLLNNPPFDRYNEGYEAGFRDGQQQIWDDQR